MNFESLLLEGHNTTLLQLCSSFASDDTCSAKLVFLLLRNIAMGDSAFLNRVNMYLDGTKTDSNPLRSLWKS